MNNMDTLYLVIPCYNEEEVLPETSKQLLNKIMNLIENKKISDKSRIVFVNDGSKDRTWELISALHEKNSIFQGIKLSRNKGHQNALLAGLMTVKDYCDMTISLDADLQDDIDAIDEMVEKYYEGCDVVYGVRNARDADTFFKKFTAEGYYKVMKHMGADIVFNHADYRLMSRKALDGLKSFKEVNMFLRGVVPMIGYKSDKVYYARKERMAGESKYPLKKMLAFAWEGITSLSIRPIRFITAIGAFLFIVSIAMLVYSLVRHLLGYTIVGWTSLIVSIWAIGGLQLLAIGIVGEYIGKVYMEAKERPKYIIEKYLSDEEDSKLLSEKKITENHEKKA
ncbi:MAG: glycosyltransferase family 2 protein [Ruminococcus sp.]|nr:glycosyltransferase family 2 protein [Ruminococcus sp.]